MTRSLTGKMHRNVGSVPQPASGRSAMNRRGFSLIEVIIATAILLGSVIVLSKLAWLGRTQIQKADRRTQAQQVCDTTMAEILLGLRPLEQVDREPLSPLYTPPAESDDRLLQETSSPFAAPPQNELTAADGQDPEWLYSVRLTEVPESPGLWSLTLTVIQSDETLDRRASFSIRRWIRAADFGSNQDQGDGSLFDSFAGQGGLL